MTSMARPQSVTPVDLRGAPFADPEGEARLPRCTTNGLQGGRRVPRGLRVRALYTPPAASLPPLPEQIF